jgi:RNA 2',3'-cyclic 3'-phosphodiesterase
MPRLFIAIDTPPTVRHAMTAARDDLRMVRSDVKWEPDDKLHCTLKFLGDTPAGKVPALITALGSLTRGTRPVTVAYGGVGVFPERGEPRIVWAGIRDASQELARLAAAIDALTATFGFEKERRPFQPHVTLGRVKGSRGIRELLGTLETVTFDCPPVQIQEVLLVSSELRPSGSVYTIAARCPLGTAP